MADNYGCFKCGDKLVISRSKVDKPSDPEDIPYEIVEFKCLNCENEFKARSPARPYRRKK